MPTLSNHQLLDGRIQLYRRTASKFWYCATSVGGKQFRTTTKEENLALAKHAAEDWYLELRGKLRAGALKTEKTFAQASDLFLKEYEAITEGQRSPRWVEMHKLNVRLHLMPFFGELGLSEITAGKAQDYRVHRATTRPVGSKQAPRLGEDGEPLPYKPPSRNTIHNEVVTLRMVLKAAQRHGWITGLPDLSPPYKKEGKISHRPWFSPEEYKRLYEATRAYARKPTHEHDRWSAEQLHDFVLFMANTGLRPDEAHARNLQHRDVTIAKEGGQPILEIAVRGKHGVGYCKSTPSAVKPYERLLARAKPTPSQTKRARRRRGETGEAPPPPKAEYPQSTDSVFAGNHIKLFNGILARTRLKLDREGKRRTAYSLRHTYICMRLMEGADIYQIAKNCRTSVEMIEKHYAAHIKDTLDATAINVRKRRPSRAQQPQPQPQPGDD